MQKFSEKFRRGLRKIFLVIGVSAVSLIFQACYGPPIDNFDWEDEKKTDAEIESAENENPELNQK